MNHMPIQEWINSKLDLVQANPDEAWRYKAGIDQACGARDALHPLLEPKFETRDRFPLLVVNEHHSKSRTLPVIRFVMDGRGHGVQWRNNFYNWSISCKLADYMPWPWDGMGIKPDERVSSVYCEGFLDEEVFGPFTEDGRRFTMQVWGSDMYPEFTTGMMFTWCFLFGREWNNPGNFYSKKPSTYAIGDRIVCPEGHTGTVQDVEYTIQCDGGDCDGYVYSSNQLEKA